MTLYPHRHDAIRKLLSDLVTGTQSCIEGLIIKAYSNDLVPSTHLSALGSSHDKSSNFWFAIERKVRTDDTDQSFERLLTTLATQPTIKHLLTRLSNLARVGGEAPDLTTSHPARAISGPCPGRSPSGQQPVAKFDGASAAKPPDVTGTSVEKPSKFADSSYLSVDSGVYYEDSAASEPESLPQFPQIQAIDRVLSIEQEVHLTHGPSGLEPAVQPAASSVEETREITASNDRLVTSGGRELIPGVHLISGSSSTTLEALRNVCHDMQQNEAQLIQSKEEIVKTRAECNSLRKQLNDREQRFIREMQEKDKEMQCLRNEIQEKEEEIQEKKEEIQQLSLRIADVEKENEKVKMKYDAEIASLRDKQAATQKEYELKKQGFEAKIMELENSRKAAEVRMNDAEVKHAKLSELFHLQQAHHANEMWKHEIEKSKMKEMIADREKNEERMKVQLAEMETQVEKEKRKNAELETSIAKKQAEEEVEKRRQSEQKHRDSIAHLEKEVERLQLLCNETDQS